MKIDQVIIVIYLFMGIIFGYYSSNFSKSNNLILSLLLPLLVYTVSQPILLRLVKQKKKKWLVSNSLTTFVLVWILVWVIFYNL